MKKPAETVVGLPCVTCGSSVRYAKGNGCVACIAAYAKDPNVVEKRKQRRGTPEAKAAARIVNQKPGRKLAEQARRQTPEAKAVDKEYAARPEVKEAASEYFQEYAARPGYRERRAELDSRPGVHAARLKRRRELDQLKRDSAKAKDATNGAGRFMPPVNAVQSQTPAIC
jgi:hypothetical protein